MHPFINTIIAAVTDSSGVAAASSAYIAGHYGSNGVIAAWLILAILVLAVAIKLIRLTVNAVLYLVVPAVVLAFVGSLVFPMSFTLLLPITAVACSLFFLFKS
jgi:hypothetical protein